MKQKYKKYRQVRTRFEPETRFEVGAVDDADALAQATVVADRLLANPVIEESSVTVLATGRAA